MVAVIALLSLVAAASALWLGGQMLASPGRLVPEQAELVVRSSPDAPASEAIAFERGEAARSGRLVVFTVRLRPGAPPPPDRVALLVRTTSDPSIRLTIPVTIRRAGASP
jgi:hypothetical protein